MNNKKNHYNCITMEMLSEKAVKYANVNCLFIAWLPLKL